MVTSSFFGYDAGYFTASEIEPGAGYWVKASEAGQLVLSSSDAVPQAGRIRIEDVSTPPLPPPDPESSDPGGTTIPTATALHQNFPNPFNPMTEIRYDLTRPGMVSLKIYDLGGAEVATLVEGHKPAGTATVSWDAGTLPSGVYLCRLRTEEEGLTTKLLLLK
jgi:hypothetical protein